MAQNYYTRRSLRHAIIDGGTLDDDRVEVPPPEIGLPTSAPAMCAVPRSRIGVHFRKMRLAFSKGVRHRIARVNALLHAQVTKRSTESNSPSNTSTSPVDGAIDDNWVEPVPPDFALATSAPAIDTIPGGQIGAHLSRVELAWSNIAQVTTISSRATLLDSPDPSTPYPTTTPA